jgi:hypothetical protein
MTTPPNLPELYKTAGQKCALRDLGIITQEEFEKDAWVTAALAAAPMVWSGLKWLGGKAKSLFSRGAGATRGAAGRAAGAAEAAGQAGRAGQMAAPTLRPPGV